MISHLLLQPSSLGKLRIIYLDHNPLVIEPLMDYIEYGFTEFVNLETVEFGYNMEKPESVYWFFKTLHKLNSHQ